ncbi:prolyl oligopeptidase family serine peptidase [Thalassotalea fusca]
MKNQKRAVVTKNNLQHYGGLSAALVPLIGAMVTLTGCQSLNDSNAITVIDVERKIARAKQFAPEQLRQKAHNIWLEPKWLSVNANQFWFESYAANSGQTFTLVNTETNSKQPLFLRERLTEALQVQLGIADELSWDTSPLSSVSYDGVNLAFSTKQQSFTCNISNAVYTCAGSDSQSNDVNSKEMPQYVSPNGEYYVRVKDYNLQLCTTVNHACKPLTQDGNEQSPYAVKHPYPESKLADRHYDEQTQLDVDWSENSRYFVSYKLFRQGVNKLTLTDSTANENYQVNTVEYYYPQAGDDILPMAQPVLVDTELNQAFLLDAPKVMQTYYGGAIWGQWHGDNYYYHDRRRGNQEYYLRKLDAKQRKVISLVKETDAQFIDPWVQTLHPLTESAQIIWSSQRTGFQHLYLYDAKTGKLLNPITQGEFTVRVIRGVDEKNGVLYFEASGREPNRDPYLRHLYRINLDGTNLILLTPEPFEHSTQLSPDYTYFVDSYSDAQTPTQSWLRSTSTGEKLLQLGQADVSELEALGWQPPEPFSVLANDGQTSLHGLIYKPTNFDPSKKYPVVDDTYTGPHNFFTPKSFYTFDNQRPALAELGFIVIKMDGRGTNKRGKDFHRFSYKNLAAGTDDHVWAIKQLAKSRSYMDIDRVGIFGFSAGGYDAMQAMLRHSDFFSVGVSASGNHDFRVDKAGWNEIWMGWPVTKHWDEQSNYTHVERLKGKLLLAHGELDSNVHPSATLRLAEKLIDANKDFDLLIMPKMGHVLDESPYFVEKRWRFFLEHL